MLLFDTPRNKETGRRIFFYSAYGLLQPPAPRPQGWPPPRPHLWRPVLRPGRMRGCFAGAGGTEGFLWGWCHPPPRPPPLIGRAAGERRFFAASHLKATGLRSKLEVIRKKTLFFSFLKEFVLYLFPHQFAKCYLGRPFIGLIASDIQRPSGSLPSPPGGGGPGAGQRVTPGGISPQGCRPTENLYYKTI